MHKPYVYKPLVTGLVVIYGAGYGAGYFKEVPTKALQLLSVASSTASSVHLKMPDMINLNKEYDLRPTHEAQQFVLFGKKLDC
jgi:hypothetical protein